MLPSKNLLAADKAIDDIPEPTGPNDTHEDLVAWGELVDEVLVDHGVTRIEWENLLHERIQKKG